MADILRLSAAAIVAFLGLLHLGYALHDCFFPPKYFRPVDTALLDAMRNSKTALAPSGANYWVGVLGFHLSHCIGLLSFATMIAVATSYGIFGLQPVLMMTGIAYAVISYLCWFRIPTAGISVATVLMGLALLF